MKIAIFGGAFDPPHLGHRQLLEKALKLKFFDETWLIPTFIPPLKMANGNDSVAGPEERLEMCGLLIKNLRRQCHSERSEESLDLFKQNARIRGRSFASAQDDRPTPRNDIKILNLEIKRGGKSYTIDTVKALKKLYPEDEFFFLIGSDWVVNLGKWSKIDELYKEVEFIALPRTKISSSQIREKIKKGESVKGLVPEDIEQYIQEHNLYI